MFVDLYLMADMQGNQTQSAAHPRLNQKRRKHNDVAP